MLNLKYIDKDGKRKDQRIMKDYRYKNYIITFNFYHHGEYSIFFYGDDLIFMTLADAKKAIDELTANER